MFTELISLKNLLAAWREFRRGKRAKCDVQLFERHLEDNLFSLHTELKNRTYYHGAYERFHVFDPKHRVIHKATVRDRLVHHALYRIITPILDRSFIFDSYSCRIGKGTHAAVDRLRGFVRKVSRNYRRPCWVLKCDIAKFFDSIDQCVLMRLMQKQLRDPDVLSLVRKILSSYPPVDRDAKREREREPRGVPIGNLTSQLFANVYLNPFDHFVKETLHVKYYLRYTDDFVLVHDDPVQLVSLLPALRMFLSDHLALILHPRKITLHKLRQGVDFLGYITLPHYSVLRTKTKRRMFARLNRGNIQSYLGLLNHCSGHTLRDQLIEAV